MRDDQETTPAHLARGVMRGQDRAALATAHAGLDGWPSPSLVQVALDLDGTPILLVSRLAEHTRNMERDARVGLLFDGTGGLDEPLTGPRVSVLGRAEPSASPRHRARFLARHPDAGMYADFGDFGVWRVAVERAQLVAGFGRIHRIAADELLLAADRVAMLAEREPAIVAHLNAEYADILRLCATALLGQPDGGGADGGGAEGGWMVTGVDPDGLDLRWGSRTARLDFECEVFDAEAVRTQLIRFSSRPRSSFKRPAPAPK